MNEPEQPQQNEPDKTEEQQKPLNVSEIRANYGIGTGYRYWVGRRFSWLAANEWMPGSNAFRFFVVGLQFSKRRLRLHLALLGFSIGLAWYFPPKNDIPDPQDLMREIAKAEGLLPHLEPDTEGESQS